MTTRRTEPVESYPRSFGLRAPGVPLTAINLGKRRLVERTSFVAWLRERAKQEPPSVPANDGEQARDSAAAVLADLGFERKRTR